MLSIGELNRSLLARQLLLERSELGLVPAVERIGGLQAQYAPSAYVGLWSRLAGFELAHLTAALERRRLVQATLLRSTIHVVSPKDFVLFSAGVRLARREWWLATAQSGRIGGVDPTAVADSVRRALHDGPRDRATLVAAIVAAGFDRHQFDVAGAWVDLVRVPPSGTWARRRADLYALADDWVDGPRPTEDEGLAHLLKRYLRAFGPASLADAATWAGVKQTALVPVAATLRLRRFVDEAGGELLDVPGAPIPDADTPAPVRFLPRWDANLLVHARRTSILPEHYRPLVFNNKNPQSVGTILVDGAVAGAWHWRDDRVVVEPYRDLTAGERDEVDEEAECLGNLHRS
jgi:hypothetical protein